jgi:ferrochelatase
MDERVIDVPLALRALIVYGFVLPFRPKHSVEAYRKIWTENGSPLVSTGRRVRELLGRASGLSVELSMRYGNPSIEAGISNLVSRGVDEIVAIPLFPHYAMSSYETAVERVKHVRAEFAAHAKLKIIPPYFANSDYIEALDASAAMPADYDHLLFSFHGVPERQIRKTDPTRTHCLSTGCCDAPSSAHATCYRHQCFVTAKLFAQRAGIARYSVAFQSRLGRDKWLSPATDAELVRLAQGGVKKLAVICPAFVADCLETVEEIGIRGRDTFLGAGGQEFTLLPCLNDHPRWIQALAAIAGTNNNDTHAPLRVLREAVPAE